MNNFYWADLAHECAKNRHTFIVCELADKNLKCVHIEECHSVFISVYAYCQNKLCRVSLLTALVGPPGDHVADGAADTLIAFLCFRLPLLLDPRLQLARCLSLLNNSDFIATLNQDSQVLIQGSIWKANVKFLSSSHPVEVENSLAKNGI